MLASRGAFRWAKSILEQTAAMRFRQNILKAKTKLLYIGPHRMQNSTERDAVYLRKLEPFIIQAADLFHDIMADSRSLGLHFQVVFFVFF